MVVALLSLIVIALMGVFNSTQTAFRASVTQTDVLESGRAAMDLITGDLRGMSPSGSSSRQHGIRRGEFLRRTNHSESTRRWCRSLIASSGKRTNVLENFFILSRGNVNGVPTWTGTGYAV